MNKRTIIIGLFSLLMIVIPPYLVGVYTGLYDVPPVGKLKGTLSRVHSAVTGEEENPTEFGIETIFTDLQVSRYPLDVELKGQGGGLSSFGDRVLLITFDGQIYDVTDGNTEYLFSGPDNGLDGYKSVAAREEYQNVEHRFDRLRFNDILYYQEAEHRGLAISFVEWDTEGECFYSAIARIQLDREENTTSSLKLIDDDRWEVIYRSSPCLKLKKTWRALEGHMSGGRIDYLGNMKIVLANGDYHMDGVYGPGPLAQQDDNDYGKIIQIDLQTGQSANLSKGHRNTQGVLVDDGQIWVVEHGARGGDELNRITKGGDYGWPSQTLGTNYDKLPWPDTIDLGRHTKFMKPVYAWLPSIGISNITKIGGFHSTWDGDFLVASMKGRKLYRLRLADDRVMFAEQIQVGERIRYAHQHLDGKIYLWTDKFEILIVEASKEPTVADYLETVFEQGQYTDDQRQKVSNTVMACAECHSFTSHDSTSAPSLRGVFNKGIASSKYKFYSSALKGVSAKWDEENLKAFIRDPQSFAAGTSMPSQNVQDEFVVDGLVELLKMLASDGMAEVYDQ